MIFGLMVTEIFIFKSEKRILIFQYIPAKLFNKFFCSTLSEFENFLLCERILINVTTFMLILNIFSDLEPLRGSSNKKTLCSTRSCVNWSFLALESL
jgi:hypothetical protein